MKPFISTSNISSNSSNSQVIRPHAQTTIIFLWISFLLLTASCCWFGYIVIRMEQTTASVGKRVSSPTILSSSELLISPNNNNNNTTQQHHNTLNIKGYDLVLNKENIYSTTIPLNETLLFCIELNASTSTNKYSIELLLLDSSEFSLYIDVNNEGVSPTKHKRSLMENNLPLRVSTPTAESSQQLSKIYILAIPRPSSIPSSMIPNQISNDVLAAANEIMSRTLKISITVLISELTLSGGAISILVLLLMVVLVMLLVLIIGAMCSFTKPEPLITETTFEMEDHEHHVHHEEPSSHYYTKIEL